MKLKVTLASKSTKKWLTAALSDELEFLKDHADVERKSGAYAMTMVSKYPQHDKISGEMIDIVLDHFQHFKLLHKEIAKRKGKLNRELNKDLYITKMLMACRNGRKERFMDRLVVGAIMATRTAERLQMFGGGVKDAGLKKLYASMVADCNKHAEIYLVSAGKYFTEKEIGSRLNALSKAEAEVISDLESDSPALH